MCLLYNTTVTSWPSRTIPTTYTSTTPTSVYEMGTRWYNILLYFPWCILNTTKREHPRTPPGSKYTPFYEVSRRFFKIPFYSLHFRPFLSFPSDQRHSKFHIYPSSVINNIHSRRNSYFFCLYRVFHFLHYIMQ